MLVLLAAACNAPAEISASRPPALPPQVADLRPIRAASLCATSGLVEAVGPNTMKVSVAGMRGVVAGDASRIAEIAFTYRGSSRDIEPLANGEVRRQIGLKLRAENTCNVVYVMWHVEPTPGVFVSVKSNPGQARHAACGANGYINLRPRSSAQPAVIRVGEAHTMRAEIEGTTLRVTADGVVAWEGPLPNEAFGFDGPAGVRSDNGEFELELRVPGGAEGRASCPAADRD